MTPGAPDEYRHAALLVALAAALGYASIHRLGMWLQIAMRLPATILHESSHFLVGLLTGTRPTGFSLIPRCEETRTLFGSRRRWVLGSVTLRSPGLLSTLPSALAPLFLLPVALLLYHRWFRWFPADLLHSGTLGFTLFFCCAGAVPSRQDIAAAVSRPMGVVAYGALVGGAILFGDRLLPLLRLFVS